MALNAALLVTASLSSLSATAQDPRFDMQFAAPDYTSQEPSVVAPNLLDILPAVFNVVPDQSQRVTVSFHQAPVREVLEWLEDKGVSFVVPDADVANRDVTINVLDEPIGTVVNAIALALDGTFEKQGNVYIFKKQQAYTFGNRLQGSRGVAPSGSAVYRQGAQTLVAPRAPSVAFAGPRTETFRWVTQQGSHKLDQKQIDDLNRALETLRRMPKIDAEKWEKDSKLREELTRALQQAMQSAHRSSFFYGVEGLKGLEKVDSKAMADAHKEALKALREAEIAMPKMDSKAMEQAHKEMRRALKEAEVVMPKMDPKAMEEMRAHMERLRAEGKLRTFKPEDIERMRAEGKMRVFTKEEIEKLQKQGETRVFSPEQMERFRAFGSEAPALSFGTSNLQGFIKSLTSNQRELHKKQGYLKLSDLTASQRRMLGISGEGNFELRYKTDKDEVIVKSK